MRMSDTEAMMWAVEKDPALRSDFCNLTILDRAPDEKRLRATARRALAAIPRCASGSSSPPLRIVPPEFADDPTLDLDYHVRRVAVPAPGDTRRCSTSAAARREPLDRSRPLWEFTLIDGLAGGRRRAAPEDPSHDHRRRRRAEAVARAVDLEPDPAGARARRDDAATPSDAGQPRARRSVARRRSRDATASQHRRDAPRRRRDGRCARAPGAAPGARGRLRRASRGRSAARASSPAPRTPTSSRAGRCAGTSRCTRSRSRRCKRVANALGGSVNDAYVTGLCAGARSLPRALRQRRPRAADRDAGQHARTGRRLPPTGSRRRGSLVPIQPADDPRALFAEVHDRLATREAGARARPRSRPRRSRDAAPHRVARRVHAQPGAHDRLRGVEPPRQSRAALPRRARAIVASYPFGPRAGAALNVTTLGLLRRARHRLNIDPAAITDIDGFMLDIAASFDDAARADG